MKKIFWLFISILLCVCIFSACDESSVCQHRDADDNSLCDKCGESYTDGIDVHTHSFTPWSVTTAPTCQAEGVETRTCTCGESQTRPVPIHHNPAAAWMTDGDYHWHDCTRCGYDIDKDEHNINTASGYCMVCDQPIKGSVGVVYKLYSNYAEVIGYRGTATRVNIADTYEGKPVTAIGSSAFEGCSSLTSINIPASVTSIGCAAFFDCSSLTSIIIPASVTSIGEAAFRDCSSLTSITIPASVTSIYSGGVLGPAFSGCSGLSSIIVESGNTVYHSEDNCLIETATNTLLLGCKNSVIPDYVTSISDKAFDGCSSLTSINIPASVTSIGKWVFFGCSNLTSINIPNNVISIGYGAFMYCISLTSITIPASVTSIGDIAFSGCSGLSSIIVESENIIYHSEGNCLIETATNTLLLGCKNSIIPDYVTSIGDYALSGCSSLTSITIPASVTSISSDAFRECSSLTSVTFAENSKLTSIGSYAFYNCSSLMSITIPASVTSIGSSAFKDCSSLTSMTIPFVGATLNGTGNMHFGYIFGASSYSYNDDYVPSSLKTVVITGGTSIGNYAFRGCSSFKELYIPASVTSIGEDTFSGCSSLTSINIPASVTSIGLGAFEYCRSLTSITIPASVTSIGSYAFYGRSSLTSVTFENTTGWWRSTSSTATSGTAISATDLENTSTAARYLTDTYSSHYWKRG